jgi:predicted RNase H-like HicB family nuclease
MEISSLPLVVKIIHEPEAKDSEWVAYSPEFDIASCGATVEEARKNLKEAVELVIESCAEEGTLDQFLEEVGFRPERKGWRLPQISFEPSFMPVPEVLRGRLWAAA